MMPPERFFARRASGRSRCDGMAIALPSSSCSMRSRLSAVKVWFNSHAACLTVSSSSFEGIGFCAGSVAGPGRAGSLR